MLLSKGSSHVPSSEFSTCKVTLVLHLHIPANEVFEIDCNGLLLPCYLELHL